MGASSSAPSSGEISGQDAANLKAKGGQALPVEEFTIKQDRGCTDILVLLIYILFWGLMIYVGIVGFLNGDPRRLSAGYDFDGNVCGQGNLSDKPYLYYPNPWPNSTTGDTDLTWAVCVKSCPLDTRVPPDMCTMRFRVVTDEILGYPSRVITCGGGDSGRTDMSQFAPPDRLLQAGFRKYCMARLPVCPCTIATTIATTNSSSTPAPAANGSSSAARVAAPECCSPAGTPQLTTASGDPVTAPAPGPAATLATVTVGYRFGRCFYSYPSMAVAGLSRCLPLPAGANVSGRIASDLFSAALATVTPQGSAPANASANASAAAAGGGGSPLDQGVRSVLSVASNPQEAFSSLVGELVTNRWVIVGSAGVALLVSLVYTVLLRFLARPATYLFLLLLWLILAAATLLIALKAGYVSPQYVPAVASAVADRVQLPAGMGLGQSETNRQLLAIAAAVVGVTWVAFTVFLCVMVSRIQLALDVIEQAAECVESMPLALAFPVVQWVALCTLFVWWVAVFIYLASSGKWNQDQRAFVWDDTIRRAIIFHCFGLLWGRAMILATGNLIIAGATAQWFLAPDKKILSSPMIASTRRTLRYHLGTAAFGSLLIALIQFIRWVFRYYVYKVKKLTNENKLVKCLAAIGECCLWCLERFMNFINKNAYIQTSIEGTNYCTAAMAAFSLLLRSLKKQLKNSNRSNRFDFRYRNGRILFVGNFLRVGALTVVSSAFLQFGKLFIAVVTGFLCALMMVGGGVSDLSQAPLFSVTVIMLLAFAVGAAFMDVWDMMIETLFQCICMDYEKGGDGQRHAPDRLRGFVETHPPRASEVQALAACVKPP